MCRKALAGESPGCELRGAEGGGEVGHSRGYSWLWEETTLHNPWTVGRASLGARGPKFPLTKAGEMEIKRGGILGWVELTIPLRCPGSCPSMLSPPSGLLGLVWLVSSCPGVPQPPGLSWLLLPSTESLHRGLGLLFPQEQPQLLLLSKPE